jgi:hypothetical protein
MHLRRLFNHAPVEGSLTSVKNVLAADGSTFVDAARPATVDRFALRRFC